MKAGADINIQNTAGRTPLMLAAKAQNADTVQKLLKLGADASKKDIYKCTAADYAEGYVFILTNMHIHSTTPSSQIHSRCCRDLKKLFPK